MVFPEAWPVAISRGDFTAAAGWFCFSFDCFSLDCATATSDKHANPNTRILLFILFSPMCGERTTLALSMRAPDKLSPFRLRDVGRLRRAPQVTEVLPGRVARARPRPRKFHRCSRERPRSCALGRTRLQSLALSGAGGCAKPPPSCHSEALVDDRQVQVDNRSHFSPALGPVLNLQINQGHSKTIGRRGT